MLSLTTSELPHAELRAGQAVLLSGPVLTARDAAHKRLCALIAEGKPLPVSLQDAVIYYAGPTPTPPGQVIGACGPTTSGRMDVFTPQMLAQGVRALIGKGQRSDAVIEALRAHGATYFCAIGGAGALASRCVRSLRELAFPELGCESIKELILEDFPLVVGVDRWGESLFSAWAHPIDDTPA